MSSTLSPALTTLTEDELAFRNAVREFAEAEVKPLVHQMDREAKINPHLINKLFEMGLMGIESPDTFGGTGGTFMMACLAVEELARVDGSISVLVDVQNTLCTNALLKWCSEEQKKKYLSKLAREWVGAYALSESGSGSDAFALKLRAEKKGDKYVLNGSKLWITSGGEANLFVVFANIDPSKGYKGITAFLVEKSPTGALTLRSARARYLTVTGA